MTAGLSLPTISKAVYPYPSEGELIKKLADAYNRRRLTPTIKGVMQRFLSLYRL